MVKKVTNLMDLMDEKTLYFKKDGKLVSHVLPSFGTTSLVVMGEQVVRIEDNTKRNV